jgi:hypothetical protein
MGIFEQMAAARARMARIEARSSPPPDRATVLEASRLSRERAQVAPPPAPAPPAAAPPPRVAIERSSSHQALREAQSFMRSQIAQQANDVDDGRGYKPKIEFLGRQNERLAEAEALCKSREPGAQKKAERIAKDVSAKLFRGRDDYPLWQIRPGSYRG